jgi:hypothetical protein
MPLTGIGSSGLPLLRRLPFLIRSDGEVRYQRGIDPLLAEPS